MCPLSTPSTRTRERLGARGRAVRLYGTRCVRSCRRRRPTRHETAVPGPDVQVVAEWTPLRAAANGLEDAAARSSHETAPMFGYFSSYYRSRHTSAYTSPVVVASWLLILAPLIALPEPLQAQAGDSIPARSAAEGAVRDSCPPPAGCSRLRRAAPRARDAAAPLAGCRDRRRGGRR